MNKRERVYAALRGEPVDRLPVSLWRHFHKQDRVADKLAQATLEFARQYDLDLIKVTPSGLYSIEDWGASISRASNDDTPPRLKRPIIESPDDWRELEALSVTQGALGRELQALGAIRAELEDDEAPVLMTIFSPLTIAYKMADGEEVLGHLRQNPDDLHFALATIAETTARFALAALAAGADGVFFATQLARSSLLSPEEYDEFGERYDLIVLEALADQTDLLALHLHGENIFFDLANRYPVTMVSWHNHKAPPLLDEALTQTDKALLTGLDRELLASGSPEEVAKQVRDMCRQSEGKRLILAPTCVVYPETPKINLQTVVQTAQQAAINR